MRRVLLGLERISNVTLTYYHVSRTVLSREKNRLFAATNVNGRVSAASSGNVPPLVPRIAINHRAIETGSTFSIKRLHPEQLC